MKLVTYNLHYGIGLDGRFDLDRIAQAVEGADIVALQEVTRNFVRNGGADMVAGLAARLPDFFHVFAPAMDIDFGIRDSQGRPRNERMQFGNMVMSRFPIAASRNLLLPRTRRLDRGNLQRAALEALVTTPDRAIRVYSVHLDHVSGAERLRQLRFLRERVLAYPMEGGAISGAQEYGFPEPPCPSEFVLMGDFNMMTGSPEYHELAGAPDPIEGAEIVAHHPADAFAIAPPPEGAVSFIDAAQPGGTRLIDYVFVEASMAGSVRSTRIDGRAAGSDHLPVWVEVD